jgi:hypothetical protein
MFKRIIVIMLFVFVNSALSKTINIPEDKPTIQAGIDAATDGDSVLVQPGTYVENINFKGKNIVVASLFLTTQDTSYITQTVIDGNSSSSVVTFEEGEDSTAILTGFTLQNGTSQFGGGIHCRSSSPSLLYLIIQGNRAAQGGAGIYCDVSNPVVNNVLITRNMAVTYYERPIVIFGSSGGGGMLCDWSNFSLNNVKIIENQTVFDGGGIALENSKPSLANVSIVGNLAYGSGGGIYCYISQPIFDQVRRCNIYQNFARWGRDLFACESDTIHVFADTFTVKNPTDISVSPLENFELDIFHGKVELINSDLFVSPDGDDANSGLIPEKPLKTIRYAITKVLADSLNPITIHCANGHYSSSTNREKFPIFVPDYISLIGQSEKDVILDAEKQSSVLDFFDNQTSTIEKITVTGGCEGIICHHSSPRFNTVAVCKNDGSGIFCFWGSNPVLTDMKIFDNRGNEESGGGLRSIDGSNPELINVVISNNVAVEGGGIYCYAGSVFLSNVTICENEAEIGGGIFCSRCSVSFDEVNRCNIYSNHANELGYDLYSDENMFVKLDTFTVMTPTEKYASSLNNFTFDILNVKISPVISNEINALPSFYKLYSNYPNPFNPITTISYDLPHPLHVKLTIFDVLGRQVKRLVDAQKPAGQHQVTWDARNDHDENVAAGLYFCRMEADEFTEVIKLALVK